MLWVFTTHVVSVQKSRLTETPLLRCKTYVWPIKLLSKHQPDLPIMDKSAGWKITFPLTKPKYPKEPSHRANSFEHPNICCVAYKNLRKLNTHQRRVHIAKSFSFLPNHNTCFGYSKEPPDGDKIFETYDVWLIKNFSKFIKHQPHTFGSAVAQW